jgi:4-amino-4-deoxy-L-arabinose transferase-like glycosyltransferase
MKVLGDSEGAARLPCALAALATLGLVVWLARRREFACPRPWLAASMLALCPFFWEMGRIAVTDMVVTALVACSLAAAWSILNDGPNWRSLVAFWGGLGLNFLNKGPVGPLIVAMVVVPYIWRTRSAWRRFALLPGLLLAGLIAMPWYLWVVDHNPGLLGYFLKFQTVDRVFTEVHHRGGPLWFYLPVLIGGFLPWTCWLPEAAAKGWARLRQAQPGEADPDLFLLLWMVPPTIFFSLIGSKLPPYVLPLFPAMALLVARHFGRLSWRSLGAPLPVLAGAAAFAGWQAHWSKLSRLALFDAELGWTAWLLLIALLAAAAALLRRRPSALLVILHATMLGIIAIAISGFPKLAHLSVEPMTGAMRRRAHGPFEVAMAYSYLFGLPYYLRQDIVHVAYQRETQFESDPGYKSRIFSDLNTYLPTFRKGDRDRFLIMPAAAVPQLGGLLSEPVIYRDDRYVVLQHPLEKAR